MVFNLLTFLVAVYCGLIGIELIRERNKSLHPFIFPSASADQNFCYREDDNEAIFLKGNVQLCRRIDKKSSYLHFTQRELLII
jgi:hypothetical protein